MTRRNSFASRVQSPLPFDRGSSTAGISSPSPMGQAIAASSSSSHAEGHERGVRVAEGSGRKKMKMKKNMRRLGGGGLSLEAFSNAKSTNNGYNPALLKKKREFYRNARHVNKYQKMLKQQNQQNDQYFSAQPVKEDESRRGEINKRSKRRGKESYSLEVLYEKQREEEEKARMEREAIINTKKEQRQRAEARRKALREKMFKKTRKGQPVMKYRIEHLLETIQGSS